MKLCLAIAAALCLAGCMPLTESSQAQKHDEANSLVGKATGELYRKEQGIPTPAPPPKVGAITVTGKNNTVNVPTSQPADAQPPTHSLDETRSLSTSENSQSSYSWMASSVTSMPEGVKLILFGLGFLLVWKVLSAAWTSFKATNIGQGINTGVSFAGEKFKTLAQDAVAKAAASTDPKEALAHMAAANAAQAAHIDVLNKAPGTGDKVNTQPGVAPVS